MAAFVFFPGYRVQLVMLSREFDLLNEKTRAAPFGDVSVVTLIWTDATPDVLIIAKKLRRYAGLRAILPCMRSLVLNQSPCAMSVQK